MHSQMTSIPSQAKWGDVTVVVFLVPLFLLCCWACEVWKLFSVSLHSVKKPLYPWQVPSPEGWVVLSLEGPGSLAPAPYLSEWVWLKRKSTSVSRNTGHKLHFVI